DPRPVARCRSHRPRAPGRPGGDGGRRGAGASPRGHRRAGHAADRPRPQPVPRASLHPRAGSRDPAPRRRGRRRPSRARSGVALGGRRGPASTIDPARRLATSLGLAVLEGRPRRLDLSRVATRPAGAMWAMTLDTRRTFDALVEKHASSEAARRRILDNRFYQQVSSALAGSHEYMAMEKLLGLSADDRFDLVVLDTPPTRHALDFLEAPDRLMGFLDTSVLRWFLKPYFVAGRLTLKVATRTGAFALDPADRFLGLQFLQDLS